MSKINLRFGLRAASVIGAAASLMGSRPLAAQPQNVTVELVRTFDYPSSSGYILAGTGQINDHGTFILNIQKDFTMAGALGRVSGGLSQPFSDPDFTSTFPAGINNRGIVCGTVFTDKFRGFFRVGSNFKIYNAPFYRIFATSVESVNDAGNFVGMATANRMNMAYIVIDRSFVSIFSLPNARASGINQLNQVVGSYGEDEGGALHGFFRAADGTLTMPIDFAGAMQTVPRAINDAGYIVGSWMPDVFSSHGFVIHLPDTFLSYDVPDARVTVISGINNSGQLCGYFVDQNFLGHGFIAQLVEQ